MTLFVGYLDHDEGGTTHFLALDKDLVLELMESYRKKMWADHSELLDTSQFDPFWEATDAFLTEQKKIAPASTHFVTVHQSYNHD